MAQLQPVEFSAVQPFKSAAAKDHVSISDTKDTFWFHWLADDGAIVGICGLLRTATGGRIKGVWVPPALRARGYGGEMTRRLIKRAVDDLVMCRLEALAHNPGFYEAMGWQRVGDPLPNGAVKVARNY